MKRQERKLGPIGVLAVGVILALVAITLVNIIQRRETLADCVITASLNSDAYHTGDSVVLTVNVRSKRDRTLTLASDISRSLRIYGTVRTNATYGSDCVSNVVRRLGPNTPIVISIDGKIASGAQGAFVDFGEFGVLPLSSGRTRLRVTVLPQRQPLGVDPGAWWSHSNWVELNLLDHGASGLGSE